MKTNTKKMPRVKRMVLAALIKETEQYGPPTIKRLGERIEAMWGETIQASSHLTWLIAQGYVVQHYKSGPYLPIRTEEGKRVQLVLMEQLHEDPPIFNPFSETDHGWPEPETLALELPDEDHY